MAGDPRQIEEMTSREVDEIRIKSGHPIPKLQDLYEAFPDACFNLDAKSWKSVDLGGRRIIKKGVERRTCFGSFSQARLDSISQRLTGGAPAQSLGTKGAVALYFNFYLRRRFPMRAICAQLPVNRYGVQMINQKRVRYYQSLGLKTHVWTVNEADEMQRLIDIGVDGIMTDDCQLLKSVLVKNGLWGDV
jgi:glycerophosphoryl diester phosphodiesterase